MKEIDIKDVKPDTIYCLYQTYNVNTWLVFCNYLTDDGDFYIFNDTCDFIHSCHNEVWINPPEGEFRISLFDPDSYNEIVMFELTKEEIINHVLMESL